MSAIPDADPSFVDLVGSTLSVAQPSIGPRVVETLASYAPSAEDLEPAQVKTPPQSGWGAEFAQRDLTKSGLDELSFPTKLGPSGKHDGLGYYTIKYPGSAYTVDRLDTPEKGKKYHFPAGKPTELYWPTSDGGRTNCKKAFEAAVVKAIVEGQKKAAKFHKDTRVPAAGIGGRSGWSETPESVSKHHEHRVMRAELLAAQGPGVLQLIMFDGDALTNPDVGAELATLAYECKRLGSEVCCPDFGFDPITKERRGYDDWSVATFAFQSPTPAEVLEAIQRLPEIDLSTLTLLKSYYSASLERFNVGYDDFTDRGNASYLLRIYGEGNIKYLEDTGQWAVYDSLNGGTEKWRLWPGDALELVNAAALQRLKHSQVLNKQLELLGEPSDDDTQNKKDQRARLKKLVEDVFDSHKRLSSNHGRAAVLTDMKTRQGVRTERAMFDSVPDILHVPSGIVDLNTGLVRPAKREDYVLNITKADYTGEEPVSPGALKMRRFMTEITSSAHGCPDLVMLEYFMRRQGASLHFGCVLASIEILLGIGSTGRSAWAKCNEAALGDYACTIPSNVLLAPFKQQSGEGATPFTVRLKGKRKVFAHESKDTSVFDEAKLKQLTGGDAVPGRANYKDGTQFENGASINYLTNAIPRITNLDPALRDRLVVIKFRCRWNRLGKVEVAQEDRNLPDADLWFINEAYRDQGALDWLLWAEVQAGLRWKREGLGQVPPSVVQETTNYTSEQDVLAIWLAQSVFAMGSNEDRVLVSTVYDAYRLFVLGEGGTPVGKPTFSNRLAARFPTLDNRQVGGNKWWYGLRMKTAPELAGSGADA